MNVNIINKDELKDLFKIWGETSAICYNTDKKYAIGVGRKCLQTKHFSGSRSRYIVFEFEGISRACADQMLRHSIGTSPNMQSGRYVSLENFDYYIPKPILKNEKALSVYKEHMAQTQINYKLICEALEKDGLEGEEVYECARGVSPMNYHTKVTMGFTIEALINFMNKRLCVCSQDEIREVAREMKIQTLAFIPELTDYLVPICQSQLWCPEAPKRSCGAYMQKDELLKLIKDNKTNINE